MPSYRIVVVEHTASPKAGKFVDKVGTYNPKTKERTLNTDRVRHWLSVGAKPSGTVHNMLVTIGVLNEKKVNVLPRKSPPKAAAVPASQGTSTKAADEAKVESSTPTEESAGAQ